MNYRYSIYYSATFKDDSVLYLGTAIIDSQTAELDKDYLIEECRKQFLLTLDKLGKDEKDIVSFKCKYYTIEFLPKYVSFD